MLIELFSSDVETCTGSVLTRLNRKIVGFVGFNPCRARHRASRLNNASSTRRSRPTLQIPPTAWSFSQEGLDHHRAILITNGSQVWGEGNVPKKLIGKLWDRPNVRVAPASDPCCNVWEQQCIYCCVRISCQKTKPPTKEIWGH